MLKIRLARFGKRNDPFYRVVAIDHHNKREGQSESILGFWHPKSKLLKIEKKEVDKWVSKGAQVSTAVQKLMANS